jgi:hypothetical protein
MRALHFDANREWIPQTTLNEYARLFLQPLSAMQIQALASLFGWALPGVEGAQVEGAAGC